jgi:hypothetical protein
MSFGFCLKMMSGSALEISFCMSGSDLKNLSGNVNLKILQFLPRIEDERNLKFPVP